MAAFQVSKSQQPLVLGLCIVAIGVAAWWLPRSLRQPSETSGSERINAVAQFSADATKTFLDGKTSVAVLRYDKGESAILTAQKDTYLAALQAAGCDIKLVQGMEDQGGDALLSIEGRLSGSDLVRVAKTHPDADAIISLAGAPARDLDAWQALAPRPPLVVPFPYGVDVDTIKQQVQDGLVSMAVVRIPPAAGTAGQTSGFDATWFDQSFDVVTAP